ncbi:MAG: tRNA (adenine-N(6)-)-methyltransferase [Flavobacteriales bacterium]|nr:tRNA (adenine-N(6)-)-methyltransferase [Flavobacteriales bacterium]
MTFYFKSFSIIQEQSAMKVGTDGVLLGAWVNPTSYPQKILDIGTGTGLIAIMLAQRFTDSQIQAIEINELAAQEAELNAQSSPWSDRISVKHCSLQDYTHSSNYDLIVCNPPYFRNTTQSQDLARATARNNDSLSLEYLIEACLNLLNEKGQLTIIVPVDEYENIKTKAKNVGFYITQMCWVKGNHTSPVKRLLISLSKKKVLLNECYLTIENSRHNYTEDYKKLCEDFYLKL